MTVPSDAPASLSLMVKRTVQGAPEAVFRAWTETDQLRQWWGPAGVTCTECQVDLRVGGNLRIANQLPDGSTIWIVGEFLRIEAPNLLEFTWRSGLSASANAGRAEKVLVKFLAINDRTEISIVHSRIAEKSVQQSHEMGWIGCLDGLESYL